MLGYMRGAKKQENSVNALTLFLASRIRGRLVERIQPIVVLGARGPCAVAFLKLAFELISLAVHNGDSLRRSERRFGPIRTEVVYLTVIIEDLVRRHASKGKPAYCSANDACACSELPDPHF